MPPLDYVLSAFLNREIDKLVTNKKEGENQAIRISPNSCGISEKLDQLANSLVSSKSNLAKVPVSTVLE